jgi:hypothetical protein
MSREAKSKRPMEAANRTFPMNMRATQSGRHSLTIPSRPHLKAAMLRESLRYRAGEAPSICIAIALRDGGTALPCRHEQRFEQREAECGCFAGRSIPTQLDPPLKSLSTNAGF